MLLAILLFVVAFVLLEAVVYGIYRCCLRVKRSAEVVGSIPSQVLDQALLGAGR